MVRTFIVTGAASGIGKATSELLASSGVRVIGVDLHGADINVDLGTPDGRAELVSSARQLSEGCLDGIAAIAGVITPSSSVVALNYFGTIATLEGLRQLMLGSAAPRAVAVSSTASLRPVDDLLVELMASGDERGAIERSMVLAAQERNEKLIYSSSKRALAQWIRRCAPTEDWAHAGIPLNAIAPGVTLTPMTAALVGTEEDRRQLAERAPMPLNGFAEAIVPARLISWLMSVDNTHLCGQVIFVDGGTDAILRGELTW
jgi:NAD(P)-dependent dehydrogenase (short-subunit alcohol dehydrogenase family)